MQHRMIVVSWVAVALAIGCASDRAPGNPSTPIVLPDFADVEPSVEAEIAAAHSELEKLRSDPDTPSGDLAAAGGRLGMLCHGYDFNVTAEAAYRGAMALQPDEFRWVYYLGDVLRAEGSLDAALESFETAVGLRPDYAPVHVHLGELLRDQGRNDEAETRLRRALELDPTSARAMTGLGQVAFARGAVEESKVWFERVLESAPGARSVHYHLAMAYRKLGDDERAEHHLEMRGTGRAGMDDPVMAALQSLAGGKGVHIDRGVAAARAGELNAAEAEFRLAIAEAPEDPRVRLHLSDVLAASGRLDESMAEIDAARRLIPDDPRVELRLGSLFAALGDDGAAIDALTRTVEADPQSVRAHVLLGGALQRAGRHEQAVEHYRAVVDLDPANPEARLGRAFALIRLRRYADALVALEEDVVVLPDQPAFRHSLSRLLAACPDDRVRDGARALRIAEELAQEQRNTDLAETIAMALAEVARFDEAVELQKTAIEIATRARRSDLVLRMQANLKLYENGETCTTPWTDDDPLFSPPAPNPRVAEAPLRGEG